MTREEAINTVRNIYQTDKEKEALEILIPEFAESEDERIRSRIIDGFKNFSRSASKWNNIPIEEVIACLEKQKENTEKEYVFRPLAGTDITIAAEQAVRKANEGDLLVLAFNGAYIPVRKGVSVNKIVDIYDAFVEKQKEASKAIEVVDRIDKYIDEHVANAHDMKDSNPDKKYYRGWDDALGKMAGILQDVYSGEKQKEYIPAESEPKIPDWVYGNWDDEYMINTVIGRYSLHAEVAKKQGDTHEYNLSKSMENWLRNVIKPLILEKQKEEKGYEAIPV